MRRVCWAGLMSVVVAVAVPAAWGDPPPTTGPVAVDGGSPKAAVKSFVSAQIKGDGPAIRAVLLTTNPTEERMAGAIADLAVAIADLDRAMVAKFGAAQTEPLMGDPADALRANMDKLDKATEKVTGDTATVTSLAEPPPPGADQPAGNAPTPATPSPQESMMLKKVNGQWRVSVTDLSKGNSAADVEKTLGSVDTAVAGYRSVLADLNAGKLASVDAVAAELNAKMTAGGVAPPGTPAAPGGTTPAQPITPAPAK